MTLFRSLLAIVLVLVFLTSCASKSNMREGQYCPPSSSSDAAIDAPEVLRMFNQRVGENLARLVAEMKSEGEKLEDKKASERIIRKSLSEIASIQGVMDCAYVNGKGVMTYIEPLVFTKYENQSITKEETFQRMRKIMRPVLGGTMLTKERYYALFVQCPFPGSSSFDGGLSSMVRPENFFEPIVEEVAGGVPVKLWVVAPDGTLVYHPDHDAIGDNLFEGLVYDSLPELQQAVRKMQKSPSGKTRYTLSGVGYPDPKRKEACWLRVHYFGQEWILVMTRDLIDMPAERASSDDLEEGLEKLVETPAVVQAAASMDQEKMLMTLKTFWSKHPCHSVQWATPRGLVIGGYPPENSLKDYTPDSGSTSGKQFLRALSLKKTTSYEGELLEGGRAEFILAPIFSKSAYVGTIYAVRRIDE